VARVSGIFAGCIRNQMCPKALSMCRHADTVSYQASTFDLCCLSL
jgi:hypothetical protein